MKREDIRIIFYGSTDFSVAVLDALLERNWIVDAIVTLPDKTVKRHGKNMIIPNPVKECADRNSIQVFQPENLKDQLGVLKAAAETNVSVLNPRRDQTNVLYDLLCDGKIGLHLYLHLWKINDGFGIRTDLKEMDEEYKRFLKMVEWLIKDGFDLSNVWYHKRA